MSNTTGGNDPTSFIRNLWGNMGIGLPNMVTPTFDVEELDKRIQDLKTVEGWLRMNLSMLQMSIQGMEMQRATLTVVHAMGDIASKTQEAAESMRGMPTPPPQAAPAPAEAPAPTAQPSAQDAGEESSTPWPWALMQQVQEAMQHANAAMVSSTDTAQKKPAAKAAGARKPAASARKKPAK